MSSRQFPLMALKEEFACSGPLLSTFFCSMTLLRIISMPFSASVQNNLNVLLLHSCSLFFCSSPCIMEFSLFWSSPLFNLLASSGGSEWSHFLKWKKEEVDPLEALKLPISQTGLTHRGLWIWGLVGISSHGLMLEKTWRWFKRDLIEPYLMLVGLRPSPKLR